VNSSSRGVSGMRFSSYEERSTTRIFSEGPSCSKTGERRWWETSDGDSVGSGDPDRVDDSVETLLGAEEPSFEGEQERLVPLLSSIVIK
jgi:hypothetical protein